MFDVCCSTFAVWPIMFVFGCVLCGVCCCLAVVGSALLFAGCCLLLKGCWLLFAVCCVIFDVRCLWCEVFSFFVIGVCC